MACLIANVRVRMRSFRQHKRLQTVLSHIKMTESRNQSTAGIIVIGDEILKGQTADTNSHFICKHLFSFGVQVKKISVIPDDLDTIASEMVNFSSAYTHVITSGGIGPTHDDKTFEAAAKAFQEELHPHPELVEIIKGYFKVDDLNSPRMKMAFVPKSAVLRFGINQKTKKRSLYPLVSLRNLHMFPGIPQQLERAFQMLGKELFMNPGVEFHTKDIFINLDEMSIAAVLNDADEKFRSHVVLGSYPSTDFENSYYKVKLTLESLQLDQLNNACDHLVQALPDGCVVQYEKDPITVAVSQVYGITESADVTAFTHNVKHAVKVIEECLDKYKLEEVCVGFNGGKDCTVLLHLFYAVVRKKFPDYKDKLKALYIRSKLPFPEVEQFIQVSGDRYNLEMLKFNGRIKDCLGKLQEENPQIKAVVMGTRHTDPYSSHLQSFNMTDTDWPQFMRVNPLLDWCYQDVWTFLRSLSLPYCSLYDRGYTSLGSMNNTHPNSTLQYTDDNGVVSYKPAYQMVQQDKERDGRN